MTQPLFETERLRLRPRTMADTDACVAMDREPDVTKYVLGPWANPLAHRAFVQARTLGPYARGLGYWAITPREAPDEFLGWILLIPLDAVGPQIEIGWRLRPSAWGKGYASEAARPVLAHGLSTVGLERIIADVMPENTASRRVAEKLGMRLADDEAASPGYGARYVASRAGGSAD